MLECQILLINKLAVHESPVLETSDRSGNATRHRSADLELLMALALGRCRHFEMQCSIFRHAWVSGD